MRCRECGDGPCSGNVRSTSARDFQRPARLTFNKITWRMGAFPLAFSRELQQQRRVMREIRNGSTLGHEEARKRPFEGGETA